MKRYLAVLLAALLLMTSVPLVSADSYNDDQFDWGEYACPHTHIEEVAEIPSTCMVQGSSGYTRCLDCKLLLSGSREPLPLADHTYDNACDADCNVCGDLREVGEHSYTPVVTDPGCVNGGYTTYTCSACGDTYVADETAALGHNYVLLSAEPSTCVEDGFERYDCTHCYDSYTIVLEATGHSYDYVVTAPDCVNGGYTTYTCSACGDTYVSDETAALGHNYVPLSAEPSTCVEDGFERYYCTHCHDSYTIVLEATGHSYTPMVTAPDCVSGGYTTYTCSACGDTYVADETAALGHNYVPLSAEPSTCVEEGFERYDCTHCHDSYTIVLEATGHSYDSVVTAPDCVNGGYTTYTCSACGDTYVSDETAALGHNYVPLSAEPSTCVEDGFERYDCTHCHDSYTIVLEATGHTYDSVVIAPDCENSGYTVHTCTVCGDSYADGRVDALGHTYALTEYVAPTCVADGKQVYVCAACGDSYTDILPATGRHVYDFICDERCNVCGYINPDAHVYGFMGTVDPSCGEDGSHGYKCWECGKYKYIIIPATGDHTYSGVCDASCNVCDQIRESVDSHTYVLTEDVAVTCTTDGKQVYTCRGCGDSYTNTMSAQGHTYRIVVTAPTCEQGGYTTHTCTACGDVIVDNRTFALGHSYDAVVTAPDCVNGGYTTYTCTACGDSYIADEIHALGHVYDDDRDADCNVCGAIREVVTSLPGDANGDGKVNNRDLGMLQKHLNGSAANIDVEAMDVNDDGKVNNRDLGLLQQYLNGKDVILK